MKFSIWGMLLLAGLLGSARLQEAGEEYENCQLKVRKEYSRCHVKVLGAPKGPNRVAAEQICREIMDNDMADCRALSKARHLDGVGDCLATAKTEYSKCYGKASNYKPGNDRNAAIKLCDEILDNDTADCKAQRRLQVVGPEATNLPNNLCVNQVRMAFGVCMKSAQAQKDESLRAGFIYGCQLRQKRGFNLCLVQAGLPIVNRRALESTGDCLANAKAEYSKCYGKASNYKPGNDRNAAIKLCDEILDNDSADCRSLKSLRKLGSANTSVSDRRRLDGASDCVANAKVEYTKCYGKASSYKPGNDRNAAIKLCDEILDNDTAECRGLKGIAKKFAEEGFDITSIDPSDIVRRNLVQTKRQCLKIAQDNFVKCQLDVAKLPNWSGDDLSTVANARLKCRQEFDKDQDECDGKPMSR